MVPTIALTCGLTGTYCTRNWGSKIVAKTRANSSCPVRWDETGRGSSEICPFSWRIQELIPEKFVLVSRMSESWPEENLHIRRIELSSTVDSIVEGPTFVSGRI